MSREEGGWGGGQVVLATSPVKASIAMLAFTTIKL